MEDTSKMSTEQVLAYLLTQVSTMQATINSLQSDTSTQITDAKTLLQGEVGSLSNNIDSLQTIIDEQSHALTDETLNRANSVQTVSSRVSQVVEQQIADRTDLLAQILAYYQKGSLSDARISTQLNNTTIALLQADKELRDKVDTFTETLEGEYTEVRTDLTDVQGKLTWVTGDTDSITGDSDINAGKWSLLAEARGWEVAFAEYAAGLEQLLMAKLRELETTVAQANADALSALSKTDTEALVAALFGSIGLESLDNALQGKLEELATQVVNEAKERSDALIAEALQREALLSTVIIPQQEATAQSLQDLADADAKEAMRRALALEEYGNQLAEQADDTAAKAQELADKILAEETARIKAITASDTSNALAIADEAASRAAEIKAKALELANTIDTKVNTLSQTIDKKASDLQTKFDGITDSLKDGLTQEITARKDGDTSTFTALNAYKDTNNTAVAAVASQVSTLTTTTSAQASLIQGLQTSVGAKTRVYMQGTAPTSGLVVGDLWINTSTGLYNEQRWWNGKSWIATTDPRTSSNSAAIQSLTSDVSISKDRIESQSEAITSLQNSVAQIAADESGMASASAVSDLTNRVTATEKGITSNSDAVTKLSNSLDTVSQVLVTKADSSALSDLSSSVGKQGDTVTAQGDAITALKASLTTTDKNVATKASASSVTALTNTVTTQGTTLSSQGAAITKLQNSLDTTNADVATKASAEGLTALTNTVTSQGTAITSNSNAITSLQNNLALTNSTVATKATSAALNTLDSTVKTIDGRVTTSASAITTLQGSVATLQGTLATKADATALNNYYTKTDTDSAIAGQVGTFKASLAVGATNLLVGTSTVDTAFKFTNGWGHINTTTGVPVQPNTTYTLRAYIANAATSANNLEVMIRRVDASGTVINESFGSKIAPGTSNYSVLTFDSGSAATLHVIAVRSVGSTGGATGTYRELKLERGSLPTDWSPAPSDTKTSIDANALAITNTNTQVTQQGDLITSQGNALTSLQNTVNTANAVIQTKADSTAVSDLKSVVTQQGNNITSQGDSITSLKNALSSTPNNLFYDPYYFGTAGANSVGNSLTSNWSKSSVINMLQVTSTANTNVVTANPYPVFTITSATGKTASAYYGEVNSRFPAIKGQSYNISGSLLVKNTTTGTGSIQINVRFKDATGTYIAGTTSVITTISLSVNDLKDFKVTVVAPATAVFGEIFFRFLTDSAGAISGDYIGAVNLMAYQVGTETLANTSAIASLSSTVSTIDGTVTAQGKSITALQNTLTTTNNTLSTKADSSALASLNSTVTSQGQSLTSQGTDITNLKNSVSTLTDGLAKKADATALSNLSSQVTADEKTIASQGTALTTLTNTVTSQGKDIATKADTTALNTLTNRVTAAEGSIATQSTAITKLNNDLTTTNANTSANASALAALDTKVTSQGTTLTSQGAQLTQLSNSLGALTVGGTNLLPNTGTLSNTADTYNGYAVYKLTKPTSGYSDLSITLNKPLEAGDYTLSFYVKGASEGNIASFFYNPSDTQKAVGSQGQTNTNKDGATIIGVTTSWQKVFVTWTIPAASNKTVILARLQTTKSTDASAVYISKVQLERGSKATDWSPAPEDLASVNALNGLTTTVTQQGNSITSQGDAITKLNTTVGTLATNTALNALSSTVTKNGTDITAQGNRITSLESTVTNSSTGVAATAKGLSDLKNVVTTQGTSIDSTSTAVTSLTNTVNATPKGTEIIPNGDFESEALGWVGLGTWARVQEGVNSTYCLKSSAASTAYVTDNKRLRTFKAGDTIRVTVVAKRSADFNGTSNNTKVSTRSADGVLVFAMAFHTVSTEWTTVTADYTFTTDTRVYFDIRTDLTLGSILVDNFSIRDITDVNKVALNVAAQATAITGLQNRVTQTESGITTNAANITSLKNIVNDAASGNGALAKSLSSLSSAVTVQGSQVDSTSTSLTALSNVLGNVKNYIVASAAYNTGDKAPTLKDGNGSILYKGSRGAFVIVFNSDGSVASATTYDVWGSPIDVSQTNATTMVTDFANITTGTYVVVTFYDNWRDEARAIFATALQSIGVRANTATTISPASSLPIFIGCKGSPAGTALEILNVNRSTAASYPLSIVNGIPVGLGQQLASNNAIDSLTSTVTQQGTNITSQGNRISSLESTVNNTTTGLAATAKSLNDLTTTVSNQRGNLTAQTSRVDGLVAMLNPITADGNWTADSGSTTATQYSVQSAIADGDRAVSDRVDTLEAKINTDLATSIAKITDTQTAQATQTTAIAQKYTTLETSLNKQSTSITSVSNSVNGLRALNAVYIDNNGTLAGYGLASDLVNGKVTSAFGVKADQFYVGNPSSGQKVFAVSGSTTIINSALIGSLDAGKITTGTLDAARIKAKSITADKFSIDSLSAISADIGTFKSSNSSGSMTISGTMIEIKDSAGVTRVKLGLF